MGIWCTVVATVRSTCLWDQGALPHQVYVMDTEAFDFVLGTNVFVDYSEILSLTLQAPYVLQMDHDGRGESVPLEQSEHTSSYLGVYQKKLSNMMVASKN